LTFPFAASSILIFIYDGTAIIFLSVLKGDAVTGLYSGAMNFVRVFGLLPASIVGAMLPAMSQFWYTSPSAWTMIYHRSLKYLLLVALPISVGLVFVSEQLVDVVLGSAYAGSAMILQMLAWILIIEFLNHGLSNALISIDREKVYLRVVALAVTFNVIANLLLIPQYGVQGAVAASLFTEGLVLLLQLFVLSRAGLRTPILRIGGRPMLSVVAMGLVLGLVQIPSLLGAVLLGSAVYFIILFTLRPFEADEIQALSQWSTAFLSKLARRFGRKPVEAS
jgi:O-antigen/teichoic acid export membrane protein